MIAQTLAQKAEPFSIWLAPAIDRSPEVLEKRGNFLFDCGFYQSKFFSVTNYESEF